MTSSDSFSSDRAPNSDAGHSDEPTLNQPLPEQPAAGQSPPAPPAYPSQPAGNESGYASPPPPAHAQHQQQYAQQQYAQQQYGGSQQAAPRPPVDGVSLLAFGMSLAAVSPVAVILGVIGLFRTAKNARSGQWAAWTGLALGILGILIWMLVIALVLSVRTGFQQDRAYSAPADTSEQQVYEPAPAAYGDDSHLDGLWDLCEEGDMGACDQLSVDSSIGSEYWRFGDNCGTVGRELPQLLCNE